MDEMAVMDVMEVLFDEILWEETEARKEHFNLSETMSQQEVMKSFGITDADLDEVEVEIE